MQFGSSEQDGRAPVASRYPPLNFGNGLGVRLPRFLLDVVFSVPFHLPFACYFLYLGIAAAAAAAAVQR